MVEAQNNVIDESPIPLKEILRAYPQLLSLIADEKRKYVTVCISIDLETYNIIEKVVSEYGTTKSKLIEKIIELWRNQDEIPTSFFGYGGLNGERKIVSVNVDINLYHYVHLLKINLSRMVRYTIKEIVGELGRTAHQLGGQVPQAPTSETEGKE